MSYIDKAIAVISPSWALSREQSRAALALVRKYEAGTYGKNNAKWRPGGADGSSEAGAAGPLLRARARDAVRNNSYARKAAQVIRTNVVGRGVRASISGRNRRAIPRIEAAWKSWAETTECDLLSRKNFYAIQRQVIHAVYVDGEVLVVRDRESRRGDTVPFKLQVLEADFLVSGAIMTLNPTQGNNYIDNGIEFDRKGRVVAYYIYNTHPGASNSFRSTEYRRVPARDVLHIYKEERPGQNRGASMMAAALLRLRDIDEYELAQVIRQKIAACFAVFVHGDSSARPSSDVDGFAQERVEPGQIERLAPGEQVTFGSPPETSEFDPYMRRMLQGVAAGFGITYEALTNDYSNVNFSSARMAWIEMSRAIEELQDDLIILQLCDSVWAWFIEGARIEGVPGANTSLDVHWTPPGRAMLDPVKEMKGILEQLRAGIMSWQDAVRKTGQDPDTLFNEIVRDRERFNASDVVTTADPAHDNLPAPGTENEGPEAENEEPAPARGEN